MNHPSLVFLILVIFQVPVFGASSEDKFVLRVQQEILAPDAQAAWQVSQQLERDLKQLQQKTNLISLQTMRNRFQELVKHWKAVETLYIAGYLQDDLIDSPRFIDTFHRGNEDIKMQLDHVITSSKPLKTQLFKSSLKTINALEYLLFMESSATDHAKILAEKTRILDMMGYILNHLGNQLEKIQSFYHSHALSQSRGEKTVQYLVNSIIDSSYKLRTWRIVEAAGLKGDIKTSAWEYPHGGSSLIAIGSILDTYDRLFSIKGEASFASLAKSPESLQVFKDIVAKIRAAKSYLSQLDSSATLTKKQAQTLLDLVQPIHDLFYKALIRSLKLSEHILDADGD